MVDAEIKVMNSVYASSC